MVSSRNVTEMISQIFFKVAVRMINIIEKSAGILFSYMSFI